MSLRPRDADLPNRLPFLRGFAALALLALPGIASLVLVLPSVIGRAIEGRPVPFSIAQLTAIALMQTAALAAIAIAAGLLAAPRVGLVSALVQRVTGAHPVRLHVGKAVAWGVALSLAIALADRLLAPYYGPAWLELQRVSPGGWRIHLSGLLYGAVVEELIARWAVMSLVAWAGWRLAARGLGAPSNAVWRAAIVISSLLFAVFHLPFASALGIHLPAVLWARVLIANTVAGLVLGWLFRRHALETAMICHGAFHLTLIATS